jgi:hypothetical protein
VDDLLALKRVNGELNLAFTDAPLELHHDDIVTGGIDGRPRRDRRGAAEGAGAEQSSSLLLPGAVNTRAASPHPLEVPAVT